MADIYSGKVQICGINTAKLKTYNENEKIELMKKAKNGDEDARRDLIFGNIKLILSVIQKFSGKNDDPDDLFQVGCVGLIKAVDNFDMSLNLKFSTYAVPMIIGEIRRYLRDNNIIRVTRSVRDLAYKAMFSKEKLSSELGRDPTEEELEAEVNKRLKELDENAEPVTKEEIQRSLEAIVDPVSLYDPVYSDNGDSIYIMDQICDNKSNDNNWTENIALNEAIKKLGNREKNILSLRFFKGKTQTEVANEIGISQAQVSRLEKNALEKIRREM